MQIQMELAVPAEYFFAELIKSVIYDIQCSIGRNISALHLKNFAYRKVLSNGQYAHCVITDCATNRCYAYRMQIGRSEHVVTYQLEALGSDRMRLAYVEEVRAGRQVLSGNLPLLSWFRKRSFIKMSREIEASYNAEPQVRRSGVY